MGLPQKLININAFIDYTSHLGIVAEFEEPKLVIKMEEHRAGGMLGPVDLDMGMEKMSTKIKMAGHLAHLIRKFGTTQVDGVRVRLAQAYRADDGSKPQDVQIFIGGRFAEIDLGTAKPGDSTEHDYDLPLAYYRREVDGRVEVEVDMPNGVFVVDGIDRYAEIMAIIS